MAEKKELSRPTTKPLIAELKKFREEATNYLNAKAILNRESGARSDGLHALVCRAIEELREAESFLVYRRTKKDAPESAGS